MKRKFKKLVNRISDGVMVAAGVQLIAAVGRRYAVGVVAGNAFAMPVLAVALAASAVLHFATEF